MIFFILKIWNILRLKAFVSVQSSLLEMWRFNEAAIEATTKEEVVEGINRLERRFKLHHKLWLF